MINNYDKIARHYDFLSRLVFFKSQVNAQINQLHSIPENSSLLIVGGGTGWILEEIAKVYSAGLNITYVEISEKMIKLSKARDFKNNEVDFILLGVEDFKTEHIFDVILTPFLFDNFAKPRAEAIFKDLHQHLKISGFWFFVDFSLSARNGKWWKAIILKSMYLFFKIMGIVEANQLIDMQPYFTQEKYKTLEKRLYYSGFISAIIYQK